MFLTVGLVAVASYLLFVWVQDRRKAHRVLKDIGIIGPEPNLLLGNIYDFKDKGLHGALAAWHEQYGQTYGYYEGGKPIIVTADPEFAKAIFIKEFSKFHSRKLHPLSDPNKPMDIFMARGDTWRYNRSTISPMFNARRMKEMSPLINDCIDNFMDLMEKRCNDGKPINIHSDYQRLTTDVIACCAFGLNISSIKDDSNIFLRKCRTMFTLLENPTGVMMKVVGTLAYIFPTVVPLARFVLGFFVEFPKDWFFETARRVITTRQEEQTKRVDFIQLMLDTHVTDTIMKDEDMTVVLDENEDMGNETLAPSPPPKLPKKTKPMPMEEMQFQSMSILLAGYETTSTAMAFLTYDLARNPHVMRKLQEEIDDHFPKETDLPDYVSVQKCTYLDWCLKECLRLHPIAQLVTTRECMEETTINGQLFPAGVTVQISMNHIHWNPEVWEDAEKFDPERFSPERRKDVHPCAWIPFGDGPRNCLGMRFALMEAKLTTVRLLRKYDIVWSDLQREPLRLGKNAVTGPLDGVTVSLKHRET